MKTFVVGDIHGCFNTLNHLLMNICNVNKKDKIILLGDYIDRGPFIKETIDFIIGLIELDYNIICLRGNHEQLLLDSLKNPKSMIQWLKNGGETTMNSFLVMNPLFLDDKYINFFENTKLYHFEDDFLCVHAGLNFDINDHFSDTKAILTSRISNVIPEKIGNRRLITGHTPKTIAEINQSLNTNQIRLDGGCVYHKKVTNLGKLVALEINEMNLYYTDNIEDNLG